MRRCYRGIALALGAILLTGSISFNSDSFGTLNVSAAEQSSTEHVNFPDLTVYKEALTEEENVETEILEENYLTLDEQEYEVLLKIVEAEAGCEDEAGRMLVANVILNRVNSDQFPDTVSDVVYQKVHGNAQFSPVANGTINSVKISDATVAAVDRVLAGEDESQGAFFFRAVYCKSKWFDRKLTRVVEHGNHIFYTF